MSEWWQSEGEDRRRGRQRLAVWSRFLSWGVVAAVVLVGYGAVVWAAPRLLGVPEVVGTPDPDTVLTARHNARLLVISLAGALVVGVGLLYTARNYRLAHRGQVTDRFTKALERLGSPELYVRIGGIQALTQVMRDSVDHHGDIVEVLVAFIRHRAPRATGADNDIGSPIYPRPAAPAAPDPDVQAALTALARRPHRPAAEPRLDLRGLHLQGANLDGAQLQDADLNWAQLQDAYLAGAQLQDANLDGAQLQDAYLAGAQLQHANLAGAQLQDAYLRGAQLQHAILMGARLRYAVLDEARLQYARLDGAQLQNVYLRGTQLQHANLAEAQLQNATLHGGLSNATLRRAGLLAGRTRTYSVRSCAVSAAQLAAAGSLVGAVLPEDLRRELLELGVALEADAGEGVGLPPVNGLGVAGEDGGPCGDGQPGVDELQISQVKGGQLAAPGAEDEVGEQQRPVA